MKESGLLILFDDCGCGEINQYNIYLMDFIFQSDGYGE